MSEFDLNAVTAGVVGANDTKFPTCPAGEYPGQVRDVVGRQVPNTRDGGVSTIADITWIVNDAGVKEALGISEPTVRQSLFIDLSPETGKVDTGEGKNVRLGRLREGLGLNDPSIEFSFDLLKGQVAMITVTNTPDKKDPEIMYANVTKVAPMA